MLKKFGQAALTSACAQNLNSWTFVGISASHHLKRIALHEGIQPIQVIGNQTFLIWVFHIVT